MPTRLDHLLTQASVSSEAMAIMHNGNGWTYRQLNELVQQQAQALRGVGLERQQRVAVYLPKQIEAVSCFLATSRADGVFVPINPVLKGPQVAHIINDCNVQLLLTSANRLQSLASCLENCTSLQTIIIVENSISIDVGQTQTVIGWQDFIAHASYGVPFFDYPSVDNDMAVILYTSGSTGKPKGVVLSHRNLLAGAESVAEYLNITAADRLLAVLPFSFDYGLNQLITALLTGASCVLMDYLLPKDIITALEQYQITGLAAVPPLWSQLAGVSWPLSINEHLRFMTNSGGKMPKAVLEKICAHVPDSQFFLMYGLTEAFRSTYLPPEQLAQRPDSIGKAIPNAEIIVVREDGNLCHPHEPGELVHRGPLVSLGYWNDVQQTAERFKPAPGQLTELPFPEMAVWSGDTVTMDEEGYLYFIGRKDDMIKTSGYRVSPTEIEEIIYSTGLVKDAVALGLPHETLGQAILVVVSVEDEADFDTALLMAQCKTQLPNFMLPRGISVMAELPRNPNGKIDRNLLKQHFASYFTYA